MQRNKYLDDLGIEIDKYGVNFTSDKDERNEIWNKQREEYGFDSRECWNLDDIFIQWLYSHLMMYLENVTGIINLEYHKFDFDGKEYTQKEAIEFILCRLKNNLTYRNTVEYRNADALKRIEIEENSDNGVYDAIRMWAEIYGSCWW